MGYPLQPSIIMKKLFLNFLAACLVWTPGVRAEDSHLKAALELLEVTNHVETSVDSAMAVFDSFMEPFKAQGIPAEGIREIRAHARVIYQRIFSDPEFNKKIAAVYVRHFSEDELNELAIFYQTALGRKCMLVLPVIMQDCSALGMAAFAPEMEGFQEKIGEIVERFRDADDAEEE